MYEIGEGVMNDVCIVVDQRGNYIHHLVGKTSREMTAKMAEVSLLMQRDLLWFKVYLLFSTA